MFGRVVSLLPLTLLFVASSTMATGKCNTGPINCCNNVQTVSQANSLLAKYGLVDVAAGIEGLVASDCSPLTVVGTGSGCVAQQQPVCCTDNNFVGGINLGCSPIDVSA